MTSATLKRPVWARAAGTLGVSCLLALAAMAPAARADHDEDQHLDRRRTRTRAWRSTRSPRKSRSAPTAATRSRTSTPARSAASASRSRRCSSARRNWRDLDRPGAQLRARSRDPRHPVPVPRQRARPRRAGRPDRPGHAEASSTAKGIKALAWGENGFRHMTNSKRAVNAPEDLKGLKMRTMENPVHIAAYKGVRHPAHADGVHRGVHRAAAGHGRRPGEPAVGDHRGQVRPGAEVPDADRPRLFAGA